MLDFNNIVSPVLCKQYAGLCTKEGLELTDLGILKPVFLYTTDVNLSPRQCLCHFGISYIQGFPNFQVATLILVLVFFIFLVYLVLAGGLHDSPQRPDPASCARKEVKPKTLPAFHLRWLLAPPITCSIFDFSMEWEILHLLIILSLSKIQY